MKYVIDTSVGFKWAVSEIDSDKAVRLRDDFNNAIHELLAPDLFPTEIANALAAAERAGRTNRARRLCFSSTFSRTPPLSSRRSRSSREPSICAFRPNNPYTIAFTSPLAEKETCDF